MLLTYSCYHNLATHYRDSGLVPCLLYDPGQPAVDDSYPPTIVQCLLVGLLMRILCALLHEI